MGEGITEQIVGRWFAQSGGRRGKVIMEQLDGSLRALKIKFSKKQLDELDKIFPGPVGEAPEAYAW